MGQGSLLSLQCVSVACQWASERESSCLSLPRGHCRLEAIIEHIVCFYGLLCFTSSPVSGRPFASTAGVLGGRVKVRFLLVEVAAARSASVPWGSFCNLLLYRCTELPFYLQKGNHRESPSPPPLCASRVEFMTRE